MPPLSVKTTVGRDRPKTAADILSAASGLSKTKIKDAMSKGAVWIKRGSGPLNRIRKATAGLKPGDHLELHYDEDVLSLVPPAPKCLYDLKHYSVWLKPSGLLAQGTKFGDHCSLLRQAEVFFGMKRQVFLVHRLDREAEGLMLIAHDKTTAALLSALFQTGRITKKYRVEVKGNIAERSGEGVIDLPLDGKPAHTAYAAEAYDPARDISVVNVIIGTGRLHQIRRHLDMIGFPVMGDPKYGTGNKNSSGMRLSAVSLAFGCPVTHKDVEYHIQVPLP